MGKTKTGKTPKQQAPARQPEQQYPWTISYLLQDMKGDLRENSNRIDKLHERIDSLRADMDQLFRWVFTALGIGFAVVSTPIVVFRFVGG
ncbi:MAG: hypothetical protein J7J76_02695 [Candidatus Latescibacteria bacterium]|nr:hypothetical protein [Candidatus Latescibacterota bacterium]